MTTKVFVSAAVLQELIGRHPEIEVEIIGSAHAQIAGRIAHKVAEKLPSIQAEVDKAFANQLRGLQQNTRLHPEIKALVQTFLKEGAAESAKQLVAKEVTDQALARVNDLVTARMRKVEDDLAAAVEKWVKTLEARVEALAEARFMALIRGAGKVGATDGQG